MPAGPMDFGETDWGAGAEGGYRPECAPLGAGEPPGVSPLIDPDFQPVDFDSVTAIDVDGDGVLETMIVRTGDEITVVYDLDGDGAADYQTRVGADGSVDSWWGHRGADGTAHWHCVDDGAGPGDIGPWGTGTAGETGETDTGGDPLPGL